VTKLEAYCLLAKASDDAAFVANIVLTQHRNAAKRLKKLAKLVSEGRYIQMADFSIDQLLVDGEKMSWKDLEK